MSFRNTRAFLVRLLSLAIVSTGFTQVSFAGVVGTDALLESEARSESLTRIEALLTRADVAEQLVALGVERSDIEGRLAGLTQAELLALEGRIDEYTAGGDALALIGAVFLVLLILELVGVTDVFKSV